MLQQRTENDVREPFPPGFLHSALPSPETTQGQQDAIGGKPGCSCTYRTLCCFLKRPLPSKVSTQSSTGSESGFEKTTWTVSG